MPYELGDGRGDADNSVRSRRPIASEQKVPQLRGFLEGRDRLTIVERGDDARVPILPGRCDQVGFGAAVSCELAAVHEESAAREPLGDELEFDGRAAEAVDQQKAGPAFANFEAAIDRGHGMLTLWRRGS